MSAACARRSTAAARPTRSAPCAAPATRSTTASDDRRPSRLNQKNAPGLGPAIAHSRSGCRDAGLPRSARRLAVAAAVVGRLIGDARVIGAVGQAAERLAAAEEEIRGARIADRPAAGLFVEFEQRAALPIGMMFSIELRLRLEFQSRRPAPARYCRAIAGRGTRIMWRARLARPRRRGGGVLARPDRPSRCTLPITALRVMPPSSAAIWLADRPSAQSFFSSSTRSSVQVIEFFSPQSSSPVSSAESLLAVRADLGRTARTLTR